MKTKISQWLYILLIKFLLKLGIDKENYEIINLILADAYRYIATYDKKEIYKLILSNPGFRFSFFLRFASVRPKSAFRKRVHAFSYNFHKKYFFKYGFQIPISTKIGKGFQLLHFGNVVLNPACKIGINCTMAQGVLIGQNKLGSPNIGNSVWIGANAILVGNITIGNNVLIAPGSYVNKDVPDNSLVIGNPCEINVKDDTIVNVYIANTVS